MPPEETRRPRAKRGDGGNVVHPRESWNAGMACRGDPVGDDPARTTHDVGCPAGSPPPHGPLAGERGSCTGASSREGGRSRVSEPSPAPGTSACRRGPARVPPAARPCRHEHGRNVPLPLAAMQQRHNLARCRPPHRVRPHVDGAAVLREPGGSPRGPVRRDAPRPPRFGASRREGEKGRRMRCSKREAQESNGHGAPATVLHRHGRSYGARP